MYYVLTFMAFVMSKCPTTVLDRAARVIAFLIFDVVRYRRQLVITNLETVFGSSRSQQELVRIGRESVHNMALSGFEVFQHALKGDLGDAVTIQNAEIPREAMKDGRGCYMLCVHNGNIDVLGASIIRHIGAGYAPAKAVGSAGVNRFIMGIRSRYGLNTDSNRKKGEGSAKIREAIAHGKIVGMYLDQSRPGSPKYPFFGRPAKTTPSLAALWRKEPAAIIPAMGHRVARDRHMVEFFPPIVPRHSDDEPADLDYNTRLFLKAIEAMVVKYPEQYLWMHDRWKN